MMVLLVSDVVGEPCGVIRAFDASTDALSWSRDMGRTARSQNDIQTERYSKTRPFSVAISAAASFLLAAPPIRASARWTAD